MRGEEKDAVKVGHDDIRISGYSMPKMIRRFHFAYLGYIAIQIA